MAANPEACVVGILLVCLAAGFYRSTTWARFLARAITEFLAIVGPFIVMNPFLLADIQEAQIRSGKIPTSIGEVVLYWIAYEFIFLAGIYLIDKSNAGILRRFI